jgi:hypothetical protein
VQQKGEEDGYQHYQKSAYCKCSSACFPLVLQAARCVELANIHFELNEKGNERFKVIVVVVVAAGWHALLQVCGKG